MAWIDKGMYWYWITTAPEQKKMDAGTFVWPPTPTVKKLDYATVCQGTPSEHQMCIGVWDDDVYTELHRDEFASKTKPQQ